VSDVAERRNPGLSAHPSVADAPPLTASIPFRAGAEAPFVRVPARGIDNGELHGGALPIHVGQDRVDFPDCPGASVWPGFGAEHGPKNCESLERRLNDVASSPLIAHAFDMADQVADDIYLVDIAIGDFHVGKLVLDHDHQFQPVEPVGPQIISEVRFIRDTLDVDA
jgi:hypothetical protein